MAKKATAKTAEVVTEQKPELEKSTVAKEKTYNPTDLIECTSIIDGQVLMVGKKSNTLYIWEGKGDVSFVEYQDLMAEIVSKRSSHIFNPLILINDDTISSRKEIAEVYSRLYNKENLESILDLPPEKMREVLKQLPIGAKNSLKATAATAIRNGTFDSINRIKVIDEELGTKLFLETGTV